MIGPAPGRQICPECDGEGEQRRGERQVFQPVTFGGEVLSGGEHVTEGIYAICDICGGSGRLSKRQLKAYEQAFGVRG